MLIRRATRDDLTAIARIQAASFKASQWDPESYLRYDCYVAEADDELSGFLVSRGIADEREILNLAVHPAFRRRGLASALVQHELAATARAWFLEVRGGNAGARRLYAKLGFVEIATRPAYYANPAEDAIVMRFFS